MAAVRREPNVRLEQLRVDGPRGANCGSFRLGLCCLIVSNGGGWDHVSVSRPDRCPTWDEMDRIKRLVFRDDEIVVQFHVNDDRKVDRHRFCLHLWRPQSAEEIAAVRESWESAGESWPYGVDSPGALPTPPRNFV